MWKNPLGDSTASVGVASETRCCWLLNVEGQHLALQTRSAQGLSLHRHLLNSSRRLFLDGRARKEERTALIEEPVFTLPLMDCWQTVLFHLFFSFFPDGNPNPTLKEKRKRQEIRAGCRVLSEAAKKKKKKKKNLIFSTTGICLSSGWVFTKSSDSRTGLTIFQE